MMVPSPVGTGTEMVVFAAGVAVAVGGVTGTKVDARRACIREAHLESTPATGAPAKITAGALAGIQCFTMCFLKVFLSKSKNSPNHLPPHPVVCTNGSKLATSCTALQGHHTQNHR